MSAAEPIIPASPASSSTPPAPDSGGAPKLTFAEKPAPPGTPPAAKPPETITLPPWMGELDADSAAYAKGKGWLAEGKSFADVVKAHRAAESFIGKPADQVMSKPDWANPESVAAFRAAIGVPESPDKYAPVEANLPEGLLDLEKVASISHKLGLSQPQHEAFAQETAAYFAETIQANEQQIQLRHQAELATWEKGLGASRDAAHQAIQSTITGLGVTEDQFGALEVSMGPAGARDFLMRIHERTGEHPTPDANDGGFKITTPDVARAELKRLASDSQHAADMKAGGERQRLAVERVNNLHAIAWSNT